MKVLVKHLTLAESMIRNSLHREPTFALRNELFKLARGAHSVTRHEEGWAQLELTKVGDMSFLETPTMACRRFERDPRALITLSPKTSEAPSAFVNGKKASF